MPSLQIRNLPDDLYQTLSLRAEQAHRSLAQQALIELRRATGSANEVDGGAEKVLTKNGASYVAIIDAKKLDYYHALEEEHAGLVLLDEAETGLRQVLAGQRVSSEDLMQALSDR